MNRERSKHLNIENHISMHVVYGCKRMFWIICSLLKKFSLILF